MKNSKLAITIPTYNRAKILEENLLYMMDEIKKYSIPIYISDDSSNNETELMVSILQKEYKYIYYTRNIPSLGHDKNCFTTLKLVKEEYAWYLGDSIKIKSGGIGAVLDVLTTQSVDVLFVNAKLRNLNISSGMKTDKNEVLTTLGWHLTQTGATVYAKEKLHLMNKINLEKVKNFPQFVLIFEILDQNGRGYWINDKLIFANTYKKTYWSENIFEVFISDWSNAVYFLSKNYIPFAQETCIVNHSLNTKLFSFKSLLKLRIKGIFSLQTWNKYKNDLPRHTWVPSFVLLLLAIAPFHLLKVFKHD